jgi:hypothetical protein
MYKMRKTRAGGQECYSVQNKPLVPAAGAALSRRMNAHDAAAKSLAAQT